MSPSLKKFYAYDRLDKEKQLSSQKILKDLKTGNNVDGFTVHFCKNQDTSPLQELLENLYNLSRHNRVGLMKLPPLRFTLKREVGKNFSEPSPDGQIKINTAVIR